MQYRSPGTFQNSTSELIRAIRAHDVLKVAEILEQDPDAVKQKDSNLSIPLHEAIKCGHLLIFEFVLNQVKQYPEAEFKKLVSQVDGNNMSALHHAAYSLDNSNFKKLSDLLGEDEVRRQANLLNSDNKIPVELVEHNDHVDKTEIAKLLEQITFDKNQKHEKNSFNLMGFFAHKRQEQTSKPLSSQKNKLLEFGALAVLHAESIIKQNLTHPSVNQYDYETYQSLFKELDDFRQDKSRFAQIEKDYRDGKIDSDEKEFRKLNALVEGIKEKGLGACQEYSYVIMHALLSMDCKDRIELYEIGNGDHIFVVVGRKPGSVINDPSKWGANAIVIDAWSGEVYPSSEIPKKMHDYKYYERTNENTNTMTSANENNNNEKPLFYVVATPYDENIHYIKPSQEVSFSEHFFAQDHTKLDEFSEQEKNAMVKGRILFGEESSDTFRPL